MRTQVFSVCVALVLVACKKPDREQSQAKPAPAPGSMPQTVQSGSAQEAESRLPRTGDTAPDFEAVAHNGQKIKLSALRGKPVILYFYPKDDTPGCTIEAQELKGDWSELEQANVAVLGVSTDDNDSHRAFATKYDLPFLLLPDPEQKIAGAFGVPVTNGHAKRITFVIDKHGKVAKVFPKVVPKGHSAEILAVLSSLES